MESILNSYLPELNVQRQRSFTRLSEEELFAAMGGEHQEHNKVAAEQSECSTKEEIRGEGRRWSRRAFEALHEGWLRRECERQYVAYSTVITY